MKRLGYIIGSSIEEMETIMDQDNTINTSEWTIDTVVYYICESCLIEHGEQLDLDVAVNKKTKVLLISNVELVNEDECDDHGQVDFDEAVDQVLENMVARGAVVTVVDNGETKYQLA
jgi:hypothetical protein